MAKNQSKSVSYELKTWHRLEAGSGVAPKSSIHFEANDDDAAASTARNRLRQLAAADFLTLHRSDGTRFWTGQAPSANRPLRRVPSQPSWRP